MNPLRLTCVFLLACVPLLSGCGSSSSATPTVAPTATIVVQIVPSATPVASTAATKGSCTPATTDGNGGPYPAASTSDCTGSKTVKVDVVSDPKISGGFAPSNITISRGTTVTWIWKAGGHNLHPFHDNIEDTGYTTHQTFTAAGDYPYQCQIHPGQNGVVHVR